jgi:hypothetical protein
MSRAGTTAVELIVVIVVAGVLSAAMGTLLRRQQRFYARAASIVEHRASLRDATAILPAELRALSPDGGDVLAFSDSSLEIRATIGAGIVCAISADRSAIDIAPARPSQPGTLSAFSMTPQRGDIALLYDPGVPDEPADDRWTAHAVDGVAAVADACETSPLVPTELASLPKLRLRFVTGTVLSPTTTGTFVQALRRVRYRLYRSSAPDWYLGYSEWDGAAYSVSQPVSGPFAAYSRRSASTGLSLRYFDAGGIELFSVSDVSRITRVEVVARAVTAGGLSTDTEPLRDAQDVAVRLRNR